MIWKLSRWSGNFPDDLETFQVVWKLSRSSENFPNYLETFQTYSGNYCHSKGWFYSNAQKLSGRAKLSGWQCQPANQVFLPLSLAILLREQRLPIGPLLWDLCGGDSWCFCMSLAEAKPQRKSLVLKKVPQSPVLGLVGREKSPRSRLQNTGANAVHPEAEAKLVGVREKSIKSRRITKLHLFATNCLARDKDMQQRIKNKANKRRSYQMAVGMQIEKREAGRDGVVLQLSPPLLDGSSLGHAAAAARQRKWIATKLNNGEKMIEKRK